MPYFKYKSYDIYFQEIGVGTPLILLHGNTASSKMFAGIIDLYKDDYKLVLMDFLGHGKSDRLNVFPADLWHDEAMQVVRLIEAKNYERVNLIGTSGGALAALNVALERSDLVNAVIADSFEGEKSLDVVTDFIIDDRRQSKSHKEGYTFWQYCHGDDWENVVDNDTAAAVEHNKSIKNFFHKDISQLRVPVLFSASLEDEFTQIANIDFKKTYGEMFSKIKDGRMRLFQTGGHPAMLTNAVEFCNMAKDFLNST